MIYDQLLDLQEEEGIAIMEKATCMT